MTERISRRQFVAAAGAAAMLGGGLTPHASGGFDDASAQVKLSEDPPWNEQGILNLAHSPHAKLRNVPVHAVRMDAGFWASRRTANVERSMPSMGKLLEANGRMDNFRRLEGKGNVPQRGPVYSDSDVYKWLEAVGFALQSAPRPELHALAEKTIREVVAAQHSDGYLNTYYVDDRAKQRMEPKTQQWGHELYNLGHLLQGATAYYRGTGERTLLDAGIRFVDDFLLPTYGPGADKKPLFSGHPEMEMALVELYRMTGGNWRWRNIYCTAMSGFPCSTRITFTTFAEYRSLREGIWKATRYGPCTRAAAQRIITSRVGMLRTGRRWKYCGTT